MLEIGWVSLCVFNQNFGFIIENSLQCTFNNEQVLFTKTEVKNGKYIYKE
jgi:hypothetical protein